MPRYIDADKAPSVMKEMPLGKQCIDAVMKMVIDRLPTEDVVEVRHGYWIERIDKPSWLEDDVEVYYDCSECGTSHWSIAPPYCPECGAKMDRERSGNNGRK